MSRLFEASRFQLRQVAQLLRPPRSLRTFRASPLCPLAVAVFVATTLFVYPLQAQSDDADAQPVRDAAVEAIQRARALAQRHVDADIDIASKPVDPSRETERPSGGAAPAASSLDGSTPRPLGQPRAVSTPLDETAAVNASSGWLLSTLSALGVVIGLVFVARWCLARMQNGGIPGAASSAAVEVLSRTSISNRQAITLLRVGGRVIVVGDAGGTMTTLANIDDEQEVADLLQSVSASRVNSAASGFRDLYRQMAGLAGTRHADATSDDCPDPQAAVEHYGDRSQAEVRNLLARVRGASANYAPAGVER